MLLLCWLLATAQKESIATTSFTKMQTYSTLVSQCAHGQAGQILTFVNAAAAATHHAQQASDKHTFRTLPMVVEELSASSLEQAFADPTVVAVEPNCVLMLEDEPEENTTASATSLPWGIDRVDSRSGTDGRYDVGAETGAGSRVYVLDTGVRISHREFGGRAVAGWSAGCRTGSEAGCSRSWVHRGVITSGRASCSAHGTHCASTVGGARYGVAPGTTIVAVQVLSCSGSGSTAGVIEGIEWAVADAASHPDKRAIISMSLGGGRSSAMNLAVKAAHDANVVVVAAAGNENSDACGRSPASAAEALTVGSTTASDTKSSFSNHGTCVDLQVIGREPRMGRRSPERPPEHPHTGAEVALIGTDRLRERERAPGGSPEHYPSITRAAPAGRPRCPPTPTAA